MDGSTDGIVKLNGQTGGWDRKVEEAKKNAVKRSERERGKDDSKGTNNRVKKEKERLEAVETRGEDRCEKEAGQEGRSGRSGFMPRIDNLDVKSYIRWTCLSVTY